MKPISHQLLSWSNRQPHFAQGSAHSQQHWCNFTPALSFWWPPRPPCSSVPSDRQNWSPTVLFLFLSLHRASWRFTYYHTNECTGISVHVPPCTGNTHWIHSTHQSRICCHTLYTTGIFKFTVILARIMSAPWGWHAIGCRNMSEQWECFNVNAFKLILN